MPNTATSPKALKSLSAPLHLLGIVLSLGIFAATYFVYFSLHRANAPGSYLPIAIGPGLYFVLMYALNYLGMSTHPSWGRVTRAAGITLAETGVFIILMMFLLLNTIGS